MVDQARVKAKVAAREQAHEVFGLLTWPDHYGADYADALIEELRSLLPQRKEKEKPSKQELTYKQLASSIIPFGSYANEPLENVPLQYLDWLCKSEEEFLQVLRAYLTHPDRPNQE